MSNNSGKCKIIKFTPTEHVSETLEEFAQNFFEVVTTDYLDNGQEQLVGYMPQNFSEKDLYSAAKDANISLPPFQIETISSQDWLTENVIEFSPVEVADFLVYGIHEKQINLQDKIGIKVYAATAFGSEHQTTKNCLRAIAEIHRQMPTCHKILDVGTGSGILAIAAAKLWPTSSVVAVDIDEESVVVAEQNSVDNQVDRQIKTALSDGYQSEIVANNAPYDLIFANILARPLIAMAEDMAKNLRSGGYAVISGFITDQIDWVINEHEKYGLKLKKLYQEDNWYAALLEKKL